MKILLDECVDWRLSRDIIGHDVKTVRQMGWQTIKNGELMRLASGNFDVFVTVDRNLSFQQNLSAYSFSIIVLAAKTNRLADLRPLIPKLLEVIPTAEMGEATLISEYILESLSPLFQVSKEARTAARGELQPFTLSLSSQSAMSELEPWHLPH
jgi:predicted nuclease of predicted toxin-antitoxin system